MRTSTVPFFFLLILFIKYNFYKNILLPDKYFLPITLLQRFILIKLIVI